LAVAAGAATQAPAEDLIHALLPMECLNQSPEHRACSAAAAATECIAAMGEQLLEPLGRHGLGEIGQEAAGGLGVSRPQLLHQLCRTAIGERVIADHQQPLTPRGQAGEQVSNGTRRQSAVGHQ
jgi:hypothetical protein